MRDLVRMWLRRKPKRTAHELRDVSGLPQYYQCHRPVKCVTCGKQYIMDMFGGWAIAVTFEQERVIGLVTKESLHETVAQFRKTPTRFWIDLDNAQCYEYKEAD